ncbi:hypothetical protein ZEAMMB73_Zm00001d046043 [Zea mays]|jgi:hypothetical protein|uniref:Uncharacterized protein n=1 Tax=Zea mays TaxID=4577 RepID=K7VV16_MAIZE|nr:hypothetical protein ZEAMMB73_Zm00001d046043 [Zea mays]
MAEGWRPWEVAGTGKWRLGEQECRGELATWGKERGGHGEIWSREGVRGRPTQGETEVSTREMRRQALKGAQPATSTTAQQGATSWRRTSQRNEGTTGRDVREVGEELRLCASLREENGWAAVR